MDGLFCGKTNQASEINWMNYSSTAKTAPQSPADQPWRQVIRVLDGIAVNTAINIYITQGFQLQISDSVPLRLSPPRINLPAPSALFCQIVFPVAKSINEPLDHFGSKMEWTINESHRNPCGVVRVPPRTGNEDFSGNSRKKTDYACLGRTLFFLKQLVLVKRLLTFLIERLPHAVGLGTEIHELVVSDDGLDDQVDSFTFRRSRVAEDWFSPSLIPHYFDLSVNQHGRQSDDCPRPCDISRTGQYWAGRSLQSQLRESCRSC